MNIAFDAKRAFHNSRGLGNYSRDTIRLLGSYFPDNNYFLFNPKLKKSIEFALPEHTKIISPQSVLGAAVPSFWRSLGMCKQLKSCDADIYHGLSQELPYGINKVNVKSVVTMHDAIFMRYPELYSASYRAIFIQKNKYACRTADHIIAISEQTKRDIIQYFGADERKISVVYQGCNNIFREEITEERKKEIQLKYNLPAQFLLNVGAIEKRKNAALIVEALHRAKLNIPLVIIGKPTIYMNEIRALITKYKMEQQVLFIHDAITIDLPAIFSLSEIFIYPSFFEGFGIPILEALCVGVPVITSKGSCFEETGGLNSLYIDPFQADELGAAITSILSDKQSVQNMKKEGLLFSKRFSDTNIASNLMHVYQSL
jgi:glycosyltransferase involved in cell wall biosynthesis